MFWWLKAVVNVEHMLSDRSINLYYISHNNRLSVNRVGSLFSSGLLQLKGPLKYLASHLIAASSLVLHLLNQTCISHLHLVLTGAKQRQSSGRRRHTKLFSFRAILIHNQYLSEFEHGSNSIRL